MRGRVYDELFKKPFKTVEKEIVLGPSVGHPDVVEDWIPIEAKHTTRNIRTIADIPKKWLYQLKLECVYCDSKVGYLAIGELMTTLITVWKITLTDKEFNKVKTQHLIDMNNLEYCMDFPELYLDTLKPNRRECRECFYNYPKGCLKRPGANKT